MVTKDPGAWKPKPMPALDGDLREIRVFFSNWLKYYADFFSHIWVAVRKNWQCQHYMWHLFVKMNVDCINNIITSRWTTFYRIHTVFLLSFFCKKQVFLPMGSCWFRCEPVFRDSGPLHLNWFCGLFNFVPMSPPIGLRQMFIREMNCSYMKNRLYKLHGKLLSLSSMKFQALSSKSMVFIAKPCWTFVSKQKLDKIMLFVQKASNCDSNFHTTIQGKFMRTKDLTGTFHLHYFNLQDTEQGNCCNQLPVYPFVSKWKEFSRGVPGLIKI